MALRISFRESSFSPWGTRPRSRNGSRSPLPDAAQKYSSCVGCISSVNLILSERGLQYLPPLFSTPDLTSQTIPRDSSALRSSSSEDLTEDISPTRMANPKRRKKKRVHGPVKKVPKEPPRIEIPIPPDDEDSKLVERATFPGYNPHTPTPLPHKLDPLEQMRRTSKAQTMLYLKREGFKEAWKKLFYNPASQAIFQDYFWWYFLHCYQRRKLVTVQDQLFNRISANYVRLLCEDIDTRWRDPFFKVYPDLIAQCVYSAFVHAYPASWSSFDDEFKSDLMNYISLWQVGTKPIANAWKKWELSILEPTNLLKNIAKNNSDEKSPRKRTPFELDTLISELEEKENSLEGHEKDEDSENKSDIIRISFTDFEDKLASSKEELQITRSKEKIIRSQAQATQAQLTSKSREETKTRAQPPSGLRPQQPIQVPKKPPVQTGKHQQSPKQQIEQKTKMVTQQKSVPSGTQEHKVLRRTETPPKRVTALTKLAGKFGRSTPTRVATLTNNDKGVVNTTKTTSPSLPNNKDRVGSTVKGSAGVKKTVPNHTAKASTPQKPTQDMKNSGGTQQSPAKQEVKRSNEIGGKGEEEKSKEERKSATVWKDKAVAIMQQKKESSDDNTPVPIEGPKFDHVRFDIYGQSPLVKHFLKERALSRKNEAKVLVGRTELVEEPPPNAVSYQHLLTDARQEGKKNYVQFERNYRQQKKAIAHSRALRMQATRKHEQDVKTLLSNKNEVQTLSNELTTHILSKSANINGRGPISSAINESLNRIKPVTKT